MMKPEDRIEMLSGTIRRSGRDASSYNDTELKTIFKVKPSEIEALRKHDKNYAEGKTIKPSKNLFQQTKKIFSKYLDTSELNYNLLTIWTLGTYCHEQFETYPLLLLMARKQSGKTRTLKLVSTLASGSDGSISTSITETHLFRHQKGAMFFDEMESISSKEKSALRETINAVYKRGNKIVRYREANEDGKKTYVEDCFYPYYPLGLANIYGFGDVLADRSLQLILQRSNKKQTRLIEDFSSNPEILEFKDKLTKLNMDIPEGLFTQWNSFIQGEYYNPELNYLFEKVLESDLSGRPFEIFFSLFVIAEKFDCLDELIDCSKTYMKQIEGDSVDNMDDLLQTFMETYQTSGFTPLSQILYDFRSSMENPEDWVNSRWFGRALKRLGLIYSKRHVNGRVEVLLNNNSTNTTNPITTTNTTNTTNKEKQVESVELVDRVGLKGEGREPNIEHFKLNGKEMVRVK